jgi:hypothetical protein
MRISSGLKYALGITVAAATVVGCSRASSFSPTASVTDGQFVRNNITNSSTPLSSAQGVIVIPDLSDSRMDGGAKKARSLLYVSDAGTGDVNVYSYPGRAKKVGTLTGFNEPEGLCADTNGNVFIDNNYESTIIEYKSGATIPTQKLSDPGQYPVGCSVDPMTGDLAVSNIISASDGPGSVSVFAKAHGKPKVYRDASFGRVFFLGYDNKGILWLDGTTSTSNNTFVYASMNSKGQFKNGMVTGGVVYFPGQVQYDGKQIALGDQSYQGSVGGGIYRMNGFKITASCPLTGTADTAQWWIDGSTVVAPNYYFPSGQSDVLYFPYPKGGTATKTIDGFLEPIGSAVTTTVKNH